MGTMKLADMFLRFLCLTGLVFLLGVIGIGITILIMLATYYTLISV